MYSQGFARRKLIFEIFVVECAFTGKIESNKKQRRTWKIQFLKILLPVVRSERTKVCAAAL